MNANQCTLGNPAETICNIARVWKVLVTPQGIIAIIAFARIFSYGIHLRHIDLFTLGALFDPLCGEEAVLFAYSIR
jgi:hypothetical protein